VSDAIVIVNHAFCDLAQQLHAWALESGNRSLADRIQEWNTRYLEIIDLEQSLLRKTDPPA
jgi:hypothetical protein